MEDDPKVRLVQKQLPVLGPTSVLAARAALDQAAIVATARSLGLDTVRLKADMESPDVDAEILNSGRLAKDLHLTGTPAFIVGSVLIPGATNLETLKSLVDDVRDETN
jgi:protein-disulfide isomerase